MIRILGTLFALSSAGLTGLDHGAVHAAWNIKHIFRLGLEALVLGFGFKGCF